MWLSSPTLTPPPLTCPSHTHSLGQSCPADRSRSCWHLLQMAGLAVARKPECSAPQFPASDYTPAAHLLREISSTHHVSRFTVKSSSGRFQSQPLISHASSHFPFWYGMERPQRWRKPLSLIEPHEILDLTHVESPRLPRCQRFRPWELEKFSETI